MNHSNIKFNFYLLNLQLNENQVLEMEQTEALANARDQEIAQIGTYFM